MDELKQKIMASRKLREASIKTYRMWLPEAD